MVADHLPTTYSNICSNKWLILSRGYDTASSPPLQSGSDLAGRPVPGHNWCGSQHTAPGHPHQQTPRAASGCAFLQHALVGSVNHPNWSLESWAPSPQGDVSVKPLRASGRILTPRVTSLAAVVGLLLAGSPAAQAASATVFTSSTSQSPTLGLVRTSTAVTTTVTMTAAAAATSGASAVTALDPTTGLTANAAWTVQSSTCSSKTFAVSSTCTFNVRFYSANKGTFSARIQFAYTASDTPGTQSILFSATTATTPGAVSNIAATPVDSGSATVSWRAPVDDGNSAITSYRLNVTNNQTTEQADYTVANAATTYTVSGLTLGTAYTLKVYASNAIGETLLTNAAAFTFALPAPGAPGGLQASNVRSTALSLSWAAVTGFVDGYRIQVSTSGFAGPYDDLASTSGTSYNVTGLDPETGYFFKVFAYNASTNGAESITAVRTRDALPLAPTDVTVTDSSLTSVSLSWTAPLEDVDGYVVELSGDGTSWEDVGGPEGAATAFTVTDLDPDSYVFLRVRAYNANGDGTASAAVTASTLSGRPNPVTDLVATPGAETSVSLTWSEPAAALVPVVGYQVQARTVLFFDGGLEAGDWEDIDEVGASVFTYTVSDLTPCTAADTMTCEQTEYRVLAVSTYGVSDGGATSFANPFFFLPQPVFDITAAAVAPGSVTVTWSPTSDGSSRLSGYTVYYSVDPADLDCSELNETGGCDLMADSVATTDTAVTIDGLDPAQRYYFAVVPMMASAAFGEIPGTIDSTVFADVPADIEALADVQSTATSANSTDISWTPLSSAWGDVTYTVQLSADDGESWTTVATTQAASAHVAGLRGGGRYLLQVISSDSFLTTDPSEPLEVVTVLPDVTELAAEPNGEDSVSLTWRHDGDNVVTGYRIQTRAVYVSEIADPVPDWEDVDEVSADATSYTVAGLTPCVQPHDYAGFDPYCPITQYRVVAYNDDTESAGETSAAAEPVFALPPSVAGLSVTVLSTTSVSLSWSASANGSSPLSGYTVHYSTDEADLECVGAELGGCEIGGDVVETTDTALTVEDLEPGVTYYFAVVSHMESPVFADVPGGVSDIAAADLPAVVEAPADLEVLEVSSSTVHLAWSGVDSSTGVVEYLVQVSADGETWDDALVTTETDGTVTGLQDGVFYQFQVIARDVYSSSDPSDAVETQTNSRQKPPMPTVTDFYVDAQTGFVTFETEADNGATHVAYRLQIAEDFPGGKSLGTAECDVETLGCEVSGALSGTAYRMMIIGTSDGGHVVGPWFRFAAPPIELSLDSGPHVLAGDEITAEVSGLRPGVDARVSIANRRETVTPDDDGNASVSFTASGLGPRRVVVKQDKRSAIDAVWVVRMYEPRRVRPGRAVTVKVAGAKRGTTITLVPSTGEVQEFLNSDGKARFTFTIADAEDVIDYTVYLDGQSFFSSSISAT